MSDYTFVFVTTQRKQTICTHTHTILRHSPFWAHSGNLIMAYPPPPHPTPLCAVSPLSLTLITRRWFHRTPRCIAPCIALCAARLRKGGGVERGRNNSFVLQLIESSCFLPSPSFPTFPTTHHTTPCTSFQSVPPLPPRCFPSPAEFAEPTALQHGSLTSPPAFTRSAHTRIGKTYPGRSTKLF